MSDATQEAPAPDHSHDRGYLVDPWIREWAATPLAQRKLGFEGGWPRDADNRPAAYVGLETLLRTLQVKIVDQQEQIAQNERFIEALQASGSLPHTHQHAGQQDAQDAQDARDVPPLGPTTAELFGECCHKDGDVAPCHAATRR